MKKLSGIFLAVLTFFSSTLNVFADTIEVFEEKTETINKEDYESYKDQVEKKVFDLNEADDEYVYDYEIIALRDKFGYANVGPENFDEVMSGNADIARNLAVQILKESGALNIRLLKDVYPYSLYDIAYTLNGNKQNLIVKYTSTKSKYFNLPLTKIQFCNDFCNNARVLLITDVNGSPEYKIYNIGDLNNMSKSINSITYEDRNE